MSVPKSKVLSVSKGLIGLNEMRTGCPTNHQNVVVNVHNDLNSTPKSIRKAVVDGEELSDVVIVEPSATNEDVKQSAKIKCESSNVSQMKTREIASEEDIKEDYEQLLKVVKTKDAITQALSIMLNLIEHNPLIVNKYIISPKEILINLIQLLTEADKVEIIMNVDVDCGCSANNKYSVIDKIYVSKDGSTSILKYGFAECLQVLETHRISTKFCIE